MENFQAKPGEAFGGGFYVCRFHVGSDEYALIVAPKSVGETKGTWGEHGVEIPGARSCCDGAENTRHMAEAGSELASLIARLDINGLRDWYLPGRDELEMCFRYLKPTSDENYCAFRDGENASSIPVGYPYTKHEPAQTAVDAFIAGGAEAFDPGWYWSSTQYSRYLAYVQSFWNGLQLSYDKTSTLRARAVRRVLISN
ncbi:hypothetical protein CH06BL_10210 [Chromobacterium haemolyticum]|nr:hypothetical protein CH06BL_10210 [Chromobacterium haemolyticum]